MFVDPFTDGFVKGPASNRPEGLLWCVGLQQSYFGLYQGQSSPIIFISFIISFISWVPSSDSSTLQIFWRAFVFPDIFWLLSTYGKLVLAPLWRMIVRLFSSLDRLYLQLIDIQNRQGLALTIGPTLIAPLSSKLWLNPKCGTCQTHTKLSPRPQHSAFDTGVEFF